MAEKDERPLFLNEEATLFRDIAIKQYRFQLVNNEQGYDKLVVKWLFNQLINELKRNKQPITVESLINKTQHLPDLIKVRSCNMDGTKISISNKEGVPSAADLHMAVKLVPSYFYIPHMRYLEKPGWWMAGYRYGSFSPKLFIRNALESFRIESGVNINKQKLSLHFIQDFSRFRGLIDTQLYEKFDFQRKHDHVNVVKEKFGVKFILRPSSFSPQSQIFRDSSLYCPQGGLYLDIANLSYGNQVNYNKCGKGLLERVFNQQHVKQLKLGYKLGFSQDMYACQDSSFVHVFAKHQFLLKGNSLSQIGGWARIIRHFSIRNEVFQIQGNCSFGKTLYGLNTINSAYFLPSFRGIGNIGLKTDNSKTKGHDNLGADNFLSAGIKISHNTHPLFHTKDFVREEMHQAVHPFVFAQAAFVPEEKEKPFKENLLLNTRASVGLGFQIAMPGWAAELSYTVGVHHKAGEIARELQLNFGIDQ